MELHAPPIRNHGRGAQPIRKGRNFRGWVKSDYRNMPNCRTPLLGLWVEPRSLAILRSYLVGRKFAHMKRNVVKGKEEEEEERGRVIYAVCKGGT